MKCPACGAADLEHDTRDLPYIYKGNQTVIPAVTADYCPECHESITDNAESERVMENMRIFAKATDFNAHTLNAYIKSFNGRVQEECLNEH